MRYYIAGPMTGLSELNFPAFEQMAKTLRDMGFEVVSPHEVCADKEMPWAECMRRDIPQLLTCDAVVTLAGFEKSKGASLECHIAHELGMTIVNWTAFKDYLETESPLIKSGGVK